MTDLGFRMPSYNIGTTKSTQSTAAASSASTSASAALALSEQASSAPSEPIIVQDKTSGSRYLVGQYLGKGGFAKCYELTDMDTNRVYAGKIVSKQTLAKHRAKEKLTSEIKIHRSLHHKHIVGFHGYFEDRHNVYILLELCSNKSLMELHRARRTLSEAEVKYYLLQIVDGLLYLRDNKIIHRDLKLGNLFLNSAMEIKLGDFGLATTIAFDGERKKTLCGTPNYIAPEILESKEGHSYEVDIWSFGCIMYTMLIGRPPFETENIKATYQKIKNNDYRIPSSCTISEDARDLIQQTLNGDPIARPSLEQIKSHPFLARGFVPSSLPVTALSSVPHFDFEEAPKAATLAFARREPLKAVNSPSQSAKASTLKSKASMDTETLRPSAMPAVRSEIKMNLFGNPGTSSSTDPATAQVRSAQPVTASAAQGVAADMGKPAAASKASLARIHKRLMDFLARQSSATSEFKPASLSEDKINECVYISKWVDYSNKYGLGYQLTNGSVGVLFNDGTKMVLAPDQNNIEFIDRDSLGADTTLMTMTAFPDSMSKKVTLLKYFKNYMSLHLLASGTQTKKSADATGNLPHVKKWIRTKHAIGFRLSNQCIQINFFDHAKLVVDCAFDMVVYVDEERNTAAYSMSDLEATKFAGLSDLMSRLSYAGEVVDHMIKSSSTTSTA
eukprot:m.378083 g.378083  ORF g.378083 m.378083 type:complete len:673 (+) comp56194_c0_seq6:68-2086(+)